MTTERVVIIRGGIGGPRRVRDDAVSVVQNSLTIQAAGVVLNADVVVPESAKAVVLFAHGSGSGRHSPAAATWPASYDRASLATVLADEAHLEIVSGATHLFEEPGALEQVARMARGWFVQHLRRGSPDDER